MKLLHRLVCMLLGHERMTYNRQIIRRYKNNQIKEMMLYLICARCAGLFTAKLNLKDYGLNVKKEDENSV